MDTNTYLSGMTARINELPRDAPPGDDDFQSDWYSGWDEADIQARMDLIKVERETEFNKLQQPTDLIK